MIREVARLRDLYELTAHAASAPPPSIHGVWYKDPATVRTCGISVGKGVSVAVGRNCKIESCSFDADTIIGDNCHLYAVHIHKKHETSPRPADVVIGNNCCLADLGIWSDSHVAIGADSYVFASRIDGRIDIGKGATAAGLNLGCCGSIRIGENFNAFSPETLEALNNGTRERAFFALTAMNQTTVALRLSDDTPIGGNTFRVEIGNNVSIIGFGVFFRSPDRVVIRDGARILSVSQTNLALRDWAKPRTCEIGSRRITLEKDSTLLLGASEFIQPGRKIRKSDGYIHIGTGAVLYMSSAMHYGYRPVSVSVYAGKCLEV